MPTTTRQLDRLLALLAAATPRPWKPCPMNLYIFGPDGHAIADRIEDSDGEGCALRGRGHGAEVSGRRPEGTGEANVRAIAALASVAPELIEVAKATAAGADTGMALHQLDKALRTHLPKEKS